MAGDAQAEAPAGLGPGRSRRNASRVTRSGRRTRPLRRRDRRRRRRSPGRRSTACPRSRRAKAPGLRTARTPEQFQAQARQLAKKLGTSQQASATAALSTVRRRGNADLIGSKAARDLRNRARSVPPPRSPGSCRTGHGGRRLPVPERVERAAMGLPFSRSKPVQDLKELTAGFAMAFPAIARRSAGSHRGHVQHREDGLGDGEGLLPGSGAGRWTRP